MPEGEVEIGLRGRAPSLPLPWFRSSSASARASSPTTGDASSGQYLAAVGSCDGCGAGIRSDCVLVRWFAWLRSSLLPSQLPPHAFGTHTARESSRPAAAAARLYCPDPSALAREHE